MLPIPIGIDDFRQLREQGLAYVDKSHLIRALLDKPGAQAVLLPRPRRFGKSLNLSMLRSFFEKREEDLWPLFADLSIASAGEPYRKHFQRYPVIHITFKGVKHDRFEDCWGAIRLKIERLFSEHERVIDSGRLDAREVADYRAVLDGTAGPALYHSALIDLSAILHRVHGQPVVILIDEYDEPIHAGHVHGYSAPILDFFRAFLTEGLKGNPHLFKAVLTGILRVARESIFSGLNNLAVYSLLASDFNTCFGFTEPEVVTLLERTGRLDRLEALRAWYNGYLFGGEVIYNPWSVLNFLDRQEPEPQPFWVSTSSNDLVRDLLERGALTLQPTVEALLAGETLERVVDENVSLGELGDSEGALLSLLVFTGYLKAERHSRGPMEQAAHRLSIPNREVRLVYTGTFQRWMQARMTGHGGSLAKLTAALLEGNAERFEEQLQAFATNLLSYHDAGGVDPEQVHHAFVIGLLATLEPEYQVRSNRESGRGRPDVLVRPIQAGKPGVVLELKVVKPTKRTPDKALAQALAQIEERGYAAELTAAGASPVHAFAIAFDGKRVWVRAAAAKRGRSGRKVPKRGGSGRKAPKRGR
jgi:hypothetical protein